MIYLLYLAFLYKLEGGSLWDFWMVALGLDVDCEQAPSTALVSDPDKPARPMSTTFYVSDGSVSETGSMIGGYAASDASTRPLSLFSKKSVGGTFTTSFYQQLPGEEEQEGATSAAAVLGRSSSAQSDYGPYGTVGGASIQARIAGTVSASDEDVNAPSELLSSTAAPSRNWFMSKEDRQILKRRTILARLTPITLLSSFVADLDLVTDWCFLRFGLAEQGVMIRYLALVFAISGTIMWALGVTEFGLLSKMKTMWKGHPLSRLEHVGLGWQLLANVVFEDLPQFVITIITRPSSVTGVLNLVSSGFSLAAKVVHGISSQRSPSLSTQFLMIDQDPAVTRRLFQLRDEAKKKAKTAEKLVYLAWTSRCSQGQQKAAATFQVLQLDPTFVDGDLDYMRPSLFIGARIHIASCSLEGPIPKELVSMGYPRGIVLNDNKLCGPIPQELGSISSLVELDLSNNSLDGPIPKEIGQLSKLRILRLSGNSLSGPIPTEIEALSAMKRLNLSDNILDGEIPTELGSLAELEELDLSGNKLTGKIPDELANLAHLEILSVASNELSGLVPATLGTLQQLKSLCVADNMLTGAAEVEGVLKEALHPECVTEFLPQHEPDVADEEAQ